MPCRPLFTVVDHDDDGRVSLVELNAVAESSSTHRTVAARAVSGRLVVELGGVEHAFHPLWLLERSEDPVDIDPTSRQRLYEPADVAPDLAIAAATVGGDGVIGVAFSDGRRREIPVERLSAWIAPDPEAPPAPRPWSTLDAVPTVAWDDVCGDDDRLRDVLAAYHSFGCFVITGTPIAPGSLHAIAGRFGRVSPTSFGALFDVRSVADPEDLAYASVGLSAHLDQPYRRPVPGIQFLHTLANDAPGGESTVVDGLAAIDALRRHDPAWYAVLCDLEIEFRYDIGSDVVVASAPMIELHPEGSVRQFRFSPRLDFAPHAAPEVLDEYYAARRWLADWLNDPQHQIEFKMEAGDVLVVDNHRVLHGRRPFDASGGHRHLQGCYVDHDGPATMWRLLARRARENGVER